MYDDVVTEDELKIAVPTTIILAGPTQTGKSTIIRKLIKYQDRMFRKPFDRILYFYDTRTKDYDAMEDEIPNIKFIKGLQEDKIAAENFDSQQNNLVIIDDLGKTSLNSLEVDKLFTQTMHHRNVTVILVLHKLVGQHSKYGVEIVENAKCYIFTKHRPASGNVACLGRRIFPNYKDFVSDAYEQVCRSPHYTHMMVDCGSDVRMELAVRQNIFPEDICDEVDEESAKKGIVVSKERIVYIPSKK